MEIKYNRNGTVRLFWVKADSRKYGLQINENEPPEKDPAINALLAGAQMFGVTTGEVGFHTFDLSQNSEFEVLESVIQSIKDGKHLFSCVQQTEQGAYDGFFLSPPCPDPEFATFNLATLGWDVPENVAALRLERAKTAKKEEIRAAWDSEFFKGMPLAGENFAVNFDVMDALIWENGLAMTKDDPVMVRGIDNNMHSIARAKALQVPTLQKQHYALMIQKKWTLQSTADAAATPEAVEAITWS